MASRREAITSPIRPAFEELSVQSLQREIFQLRRRRTAGDDCIEYIVEDNSFRPAAGLDGKENKLPSLSLEHPHRYRSKQKLGLRCPCYSLDIDDSQEQRPGHRSLRGPGGRYAPIARGGGSGGRGGLLCRSVRAAPSPPSRDPESLLPATPSSPEAPNSGGSSPPLAAANSGGSSPPPAASANPVGSGDPGQPAAVAGGGPPDPGAGDEAGAVLPPPPNERNFNWELGHLTIATAYLTTLYMTSGSEVEGWIKAKLPDYIPLYIYPLEVCCALIGLGIMASTAVISHHILRPMASAGSRLASTIATFLMMVALSKPVGYRPGVILGGVVSTAMLVLWFVGSPGAMELQEKLWHLLKSVSSAVWGYIRRTASSAWGFLKPAISSLQNLAQQM